MSEWIHAWHRYRRQNRFLLGLFFFLLVLILGGIYLANRAHVESPQDLTNRLLFFALWYFDLSLIFVLLFILARNLLRLALERRSGVLGSRFRTKLVLTYVALTFVPVLFIFLIATNLLQRSIERWFSAPVEDVLRSGFSVTEQLRELVEQRLEVQAAEAAHQLSGDPDPERLERLGPLLGTEYIALYEGRQLVEGQADPRRTERMAPPLAWDQPRGHRTDRWQGGLLVRAWHPVGERHTVVVGDLLPRDLLLNLDATAAAHATFQEMKLQRGTVTSTTILVFLAITLLLLFGTVWIGLFLSRRFTEPLLAVAAATQRVAEGDSLEEVASPATDEVAVLVDSFNAMVRRVRATEAEILASNQELETLLATVPTGVLTVSADGRRMRPNPAAARLLGQANWAGEWCDFDELDRPGLEVLHRYLREEEPAGDGKQLQLEVGATLRWVDVTRMALPGGGQVVAVDELTQLLRAQRQAAWSEVARRIAHEIKNPLTPIRLAAERIQRRASQLDGEIGQVIASGTAAIIAHVAGLKELVDSFHQYARMPGVNPRPTWVRQILDEVVLLYQDLRDDIRIERVLPETEVCAMVDPSLLRQALVNLMDNSIEAMATGGNLRLEARVDGSDLVIEVADSGVGFPTDDIETLLQPFYSTKGRGSGMGLALVHRIVADHGGSLEIGRGESQGAWVRLLLNRAVIEEEALPPA